MYIEKYWRNYIGGTDDSLNLVAFLADQQQDEISLSEIFRKIGLDKQNWNFRQTAGYLEFTHSNGVEMDFHFAIDVITDLAAIMLECYVNGYVNLHDLDDCEIPNRHMRITATPEEHHALNRALSDFAQNPLNYDLRELVGDEDMMAMAKDCEEIRKELYESGGRNKNFNIPKEEMKTLLTDWTGANGCLATNRIMVEGCKVGYCYREKPDDDWDSGWRFTAGDESQPYMDDPSHSGLYALNTVCNDDPDIIPLLKAPYGSAFSRDDQGMFHPVSDETPPEPVEEKNMDLMQQCQIWNEQDQFRKIIDALEAIPEDERTPEMDCELARAYNNEASADDRDMLKHSIALLKKHEEQFRDDHRWNFRMAYAYFYLDQEHRALPYFEKALEALPGDEDTEEFIEKCRYGVSMPLFRECFRERTIKAWKAFMDQEADLRKIIDEDKNHERGQELVDRFEAIFNLAFEEVAFEIGFNGQKHEVVLSPEGDKVNLFELVYFQEHAPKEVSEHWNILVGRQRLGDVGMRTNDFDITGRDVRIWVEQTDEKRVALKAYCEKLLPDLKEQEGKVYWALTTLTDQVLGEIPHMRYVDSFEALDQPLDDQGILLTELPKKLESLGLDLSLDPKGCLNSALCYQLKPDDDPDADWRLDVIAGSTCCVPLINDYLSNETDFTDSLLDDGVVAGFLIYPLDGFTGEDQSERIFEFREQLENALSEGDGEDIITLIGGATGTQCGYVDFIAWDARAVVKKAKAFFEKSPVEWASFHVFRREAGTVGLKSPKQSDPDPKEDSGDQAPESEANQDKTSSETTLKYSPETVEAFYKQIDDWNDQDEYSQCVRALESIPKDQQTYRSAYALARALENYAILGDHEEGTATHEAQKALKRAIEVLENVREEGSDKAEWYMRMAYGYQYMTEQEEKAIPYARRWAELDPNDECAPMVIQECARKIRQRLRQTVKVKFTPGSSPFEGFDFTNFWNDSEYALDKYVSEPPSDELIADIEKELGYKLPASYISLMKQHNGGTPVNTCYPTNEPTSWAEDHVAITGIYGIGRDKQYSLCGELGSRFLVSEWGYPSIGVAICDCPSAGHDAIFLDYRACGPEGEPAVVHVDQELDYKITHLADSFEEFIRGLQNNAVFDEELDDEEDTDENEAGDSKQADQKGAFAGFVLLSKGRWDKEQLIRDLQEQWNITVQESDEDGEKRDDALVFDVGDKIAAISLMPFPIPNNEAETNAENNWMWPEAVNAAKEHCAHIMVAVCGGKDDDLIERGKLFVKLMDACCRQQYVTGVYTSGVVFDPKFYKKGAEAMKDDDLPIHAWIWVGLYSNGQTISAYTYGMETFGRREMEVLDVEGATAGDVWRFLSAMASYVLECDQTLEDGQTIGFSADDIHDIKLSEGVALPGMTLKISYGNGMPQD